MNKLTIWIIILLIFALPVFSSGEGVSELTESTAVKELPVTRVTLYTAGLAQMVHESTVTDNEVLNFQVEPKDINDILKSLVVEDLDGGTVDVVNFDSSDPLNVVLSDLRINPAGSPTISTFLQRTQGEYVVVTTNGKEFEGRIFSVEEKQSEEGINVILNLFNNSGLISVNITELENLRFADPLLQQELLTALGTIADSRLKSVRTLKISFKGEGKRRVRLSYIRAVPLWKTSYRVALDEEGSARLEGWAIVQNTGSSAWKDVQLSFVAGMPNAFTMDLATPKYVTRERVDSVASAPIGSTSYKKAYAPAPVASRSLAYDAPSMAMSKEMIYEENESYMPQAVTAQATSASSGNFYRYDVNHPVTVNARSSAMIPIIQLDDAGKTLGIWDPSYNLVFKGIRLSNDSGIQWAAGPVTVLEGRYYGGDAMLPEMLPDSERLLSYAVHGSLEIDRQVETSPRRMTSLKISGGILYRIDKMEKETLYRIDGEEEELIIIHPHDSDWKLINGPEIIEENASEYRFLLKEWDKPVSVLEEYTISNQFGLINFQASDLILYLNWDEITPEMRRTFERITVLKKNVDNIRTEINNLNSRLSRIDRDQSRLRENMKVLDKESDLFKRYSDQLEAQENEIIKLNSNIDKRRIDASDAEKELRDYIDSIDIG